MQRKTLKNTSVLPTAVQKAKEKEAKEKLEKAKLAKEKEEREKLEKAKLEKEKLEKEKLEKEKSKSKRRTITSKKKIILKALKNNKKTIIVVVAAILLIIVIVAIINNKTTGNNPITEKYVIRDTTNVKNIIGLVEEDWYYSLPDVVKLSDSQYDSVYYNKSLKSYVGIKLIKEYKYSNIKSTDELIDYYTNKGYKSVSAHEQRLNGLHTKVITLKDENSRTGYIYYIDYGNYLIFASGTYANDKDKTKAENFITNLSVPSNDFEIRIVEYFNKDLPINEVVKK